MDPWWSHVPIALPAMLEVDLSWNSLGDVYLGFKAIHAGGLALHCGDKDSTHATPDLVGLHQSGIHISIVGDFFCWLR